MNKSLDSSYIVENYIRDERDFLTPLPAIERLRRILTAQAVAPFVFPTNSVPAIDISGIGQTKAVAAAFSQLYAAGWKLLIMRASIGLTPDALFDYFWRAGHDAGMYMIVYHLVYPGISGYSQASVFLKTIEPMLTAINGHSAAVRDVEVSGDVAEWRKAITEFGIVVRPKLITGDYSSVFKWKSCTNNMPVPGFAWNASWSNLVNVPSFAPAAQTILRQIGVYLKHDWVPRPPGINEDIDVDYWMGTESSLRNFLGYDTPQPPPPPPPSDLEARVINLENKVNILDAEQKKMQDDLTDDEVMIANHEVSISNHQILIVNLRKDVDDLMGSEPEPPGPQPNPETWEMTVRPADEEDQRAKVYCFQVWNEDQGKVVEKRNKEQKPIMQEYLDDDGKRITYDRGDKVVTYKAITDTDGSTPDCYKIYNYFGDHRVELFLLKTDVIKPY